MGRVLVQIHLDALPMEYKQQNPAVRRSAPGLPIIMPCLSIFRGRIGARPGFDANHASMEPDSPRFARESA